MRPSFVIFGLGDPEGRVIRDLHHPRIVNLQKALDQGRMQQTNRAADSVPERSAPLPAPRARWSHQPLIPTRGAFIFKANQRYQEESK